jgi:hypothetical protein
VFFFDYIIHLDTVNQSRSKCPTVVTVLEMEQIPQERLAVEIRDVRTSCSLNRYADKMSV